MDDEQIKEFSKVLSQKLRHVKLAISKANMGQNKYADFGDDNMNKSITQNQSNIYNPSVTNNGNKSFISNAMSSVKKITEKEEKKTKKRLKPLVSKASIVAGYIQTSKKDMTPAEIFESYRFELDRQISDLKRPFQLLIRKTKIKPISNILLKSNSIEYSKNDNDQLINKLLKD
jgi:hypothetical protein